MSSLLPFVRSFKGGRVRCPQCGGSGRVGCHAEGREVVCDSCGGYGRYVSHDPGPVVVSYLAIQGAEVIDESEDSLEDFIAAQCRTWELTEDVAIWERGERGLRVVAILGPGDKGQTAVRWM